MKYIPRILEHKLREYLAFFSVIGLTGPRQSGKSTLLLEKLPEYTYVTFDDYAIVNLFYDDPEKFMRIYHDKVVFDEVQKVPEIFNYIKLAVDRDRQNTGKFILTGSSQFAFLKGVSESLAGRIGLLSLLPFQYVEIPASLRDKAIYRGSYPELVDKHYQLSEDWYSAYMNTYLTKDVSALSNIGDMRDFQRLIYLLAANHAQILNMSRYASDLGVDVKTIKRWISILEASYIIFLLPAYYRNYGKRVVKSPKIYFYDTGLISYLVGIREQKQFEQGPLAGALFENYVVAEILKREIHNKTLAELFYYRTSAGLEVDLIIDRKQYLELIEIKKSETFKAQMLSAVEQIKQEKDKGYLLYSGKNRPYTDNIAVMNINSYLEQN